MPRTPLAIPPSTLAAGAAAATEIAGQGIAHAVGGVARLIIESANCVRVNTKTALAIASRVNDMTVTLDSILVGYPALGVGDALEVFKAALTVIQIELAAHGERPYLVQLLHQQRDRETLDALSAKMHDAFKSLMVETMLEGSASAFETLDSEALHSREVQPGARLPPAPHLYFGRAAETQLLVDALCTGPAVRAAILGAPGMGKTTLSLSVLHHPSVASRFGADRFFVPCDAAEAKQNCLTTITESLGIVMSNSAVSKHKLKELLGSPRDLQLFPQLSASLAHCPYSLMALATLLRTSLATRAADSRVYVLAPIRGFMLARYPPLEEDLSPLYEHYFRLAELAKQSIQLASQPEIVPGLNAELANIDSIIRHALQHSGTQDRSAVQAAAALLFLFNEVHLGPGLDLLPAALAVARTMRYDELCADLLLRWGIVAFNGGAEGDPEALFREAAELYERVGNDERSIASGLQLLHYRDPHDAVEDARQLFDRARSLQNYQRMAQCADELGRALNRLGMPFEALVHRERAISLFRLAVKQGAHERTLGYYQYRLAVEYHKLGRLERADRLFQDALSIFESLQVGFGLTQARMRLADLCLDQGRVADAITAVAPILSAKDVPSFRGYFHCLIIATQAHALAGSISAATETLARIHQCKAADSLTSHEFVCIMLSHAAVSWTSGDFVEMQALLVAALSRARAKDKVETSEGMLQAEAHVLRALGEAAFAQGSYNRAVTLACTSSVIFATSHNKIDAVKSLLLLAEALDTASAKPLLVAIHPAIESMGLSYDRAKMLLRFAGIASERKQEDVAQQHARDALLEFQSIPTDWRIARAQQLSAGAECN
ncbi:hypothetical protein AURDEDRAFT_123442 [Auricularia subglabra TFB-10046 SS5]|nr:hypothetical protein AURDEDRAFT_123442 [Auricularia subglabra TFB-10046 SS5]